MGKRYNQKLLKAAEEVSIGFQVHRVNAEPKGRVDARLFRASATARTDPYSNDLQVSFLSEEM